MAIATCDRHLLKALSLLTIHKLAIFAANHPSRHIVIWVIKVQVLVVVDSSKVDVVVVATTLNTKLTLGSPLQTHHNLGTLPTQDEAACPLSKPKVAHNTKTRRIKLLEAQP
jgi:hypothetical protein